MGNVQCLQMHQSPLHRQDPRNELGVRQVLAFIPLNNLFQVLKGPINPHSSDPTTFDGTVQLCSLRHYAGHIIDFVSE